MSTYLDMNDWNAFLLLFHPPHFCAMICTVIFVCKEAALHYIHANHYLHLLP